jgi:hypothetical protein
MAGRRRPPRYGVVAWWTVEVDDVHAPAGRGVMDEGRNYIPGEHSLSEEAGFGMLEVDDVAVGDVSTAGVEE